MIRKQDSQYMCNVTMRSVRAPIITVENQ